MPPSGLPDERKGEKIVLITDRQDATRKEIQAMARRLKYGELAIPRKVVLAEALPVLGTGKIDYPTLTQKALEEDARGSGWTSKLTGLIKKPESGEESSDPAAENAGANEQDSGQ